MGFAIYISGASSTEGEWGRAFASALDRLPPLSGEELETAKRHGGSGEEYRRSKMANALAVERLESEGRMIGGRAQEILSRWAGDCEVEAVSWQGAKSRWVLRVRGAGSKTANISVPSELADGVVGPSAEQDVERLKNLLLFGVGRQDLILRH